MNPINQMNPNYQPFRQFPMGQAGQPPMMAALNNRFNQSSMINSLTQMP